MTDPGGRAGRRSERHNATKREIVGIAWELSRTAGLAGWSLRDVADRVGMRAPSLYVYFASKNALYDAMFAEGYAALLARVDDRYAELRARHPDAEEILRTVATVFFEFCVEDPARYQLLFLRTVPGFEPSESAYALAREVLSRLEGVMAGAGVGTPEQVDLWTALITGLASQQVSNDPGGNRWRRLVDRAVEMFVAAELRPAL